MQAINLVRAKPTYIHSMKYWLIHYWLILATDWVFVWSIKTSQIMLFFEMLIFDVDCSQLFKENN
jgi:hypothetical protein